jgi:hypothetical protein
LKEEGSFDVSEMARKEVVRLEAGSKWAVKSLDRVLARGLGRDVVLYLIVLYVDL